MKKRSYKRKLGREEAHLLVGKIFDEEQQFSLKFGHPIFNDAILLGSNHHLFLDHSKSNILKQMVMAPHGYKGYPPNSSPFNVIPSAILHGKDQISVEVIELFVFIFIHHSHVLHYNL